MWNDDFAQQSALYRRFVAIERKRDGTRGRVQRAGCDRQLLRVEQVEQMSEQDRAGGVADQMHFDVRHALLQVEQRGGDQRPCVVLFG